MQRIGGKGNVRNVGIERTRVRRGQSEEVGDEEKEYRG